MAKAFLPSNVSATYSLFHWKMIEALLYFLHEASGYKVCDFAKTLCRYRNTLGIISLCNNRVYSQHCAVSQKSQAVPFSWEYWAKPTFL